MVEVKEVIYQWRQGISKSGIARSLGMARNTVKMIIKHAKKLGLGEESDEVVIEKVNALHYPPNSNSKPGSIQAYISQQHGQIVDWLSIPDMTIVQMVRLFKKGGHSISETSLRRYLKGAQLLPNQKVTVHLITQAGDQGQVDFGYVGLMWDTKKERKRKAYAFVMTLSHSRYRFVRFVFHQDTKTWVDCHIRAFSFFNGVPKSILLDNLKAGIIRADIYDPTLNRTYAELERFYGFVADPAKVRKPAHKGKVERSIPIVRQQLIAGCDYININEANKRALQWCKDEIAHVVTRTTGETPATIFFREEQAVLLKLPVQVFDCPEWQEAKVHRDHHIVFSRSFYSVPTR